MTKENSAIGFWQFPPALKFVVIWTGMLGLLNLYTFLCKAFYTFSVDIIAFLLSFVYFALVNELNNRRNGARVLSITFVIMGSIFRVVLLVSILFSLPLGYDLFGLPLTGSQKSILLVLNLALNAIILYILLRPSTKALFSHSPAPSSESAQQESQ